MNGNVERDFKLFGQGSVFTPGEVLEVIREDHDRLERMIDELQERVNADGRRI
jgi:hypothetical protein